MITRLESGSVSCDNQMGEWRAGSCDNQTGEWRAVSCDNQTESGEQDHVITRRRVESSIM